MKRVHTISITPVSPSTAVAVFAQPPEAVPLPPGQTCKLLTQANADASAGTHFFSSGPQVPPRAAKIIIIIIIIMYVQPGHALTRKGTSWPVGETD